MITNRVLSIKKIVVAIYVRLVKPNVMQKLHEMNIMIQLKVQTHQNTFEATSTTSLHELSFQMLQKMLRPGKTQKHHILLSGNLILMSKRTLKDWFYLEMVSYRAIDDIMQTLKKEVHFFFLPVRCIVFNCSLQLIIFDKKQKSSVKCIHLVTDDSLYD